MANRKLHVDNNTQKTRKRSANEALENVQIETREQLECVLRKARLSCSNAINQHTRISCFEAAFPLGSGRHSHDKALDLLADCREFRRSQDKAEKGEFFISSFRSSVTNWAEVIGAFQQPDEEADILAEEAATKEKLLHFLSTVNSSYGSSSTEAPSYCEPCDPVATAASPPPPTCCDQKTCCEHKPATFKHKFVVREKATDNQPVTVCRMCWLLLYNFTKHEADALSTRIRSTENPRANPRAVQEYNDASYHDFAYGETVEMFSTIPGVGASQATEFAAAALV
ncbi:hypothetical protein B484DRAFT_461622, partial [Ochromonadaceae sp. CCMP2298]